LLLVDRESGAWARKHIYHWFTEGLGTQQKMRAFLFTVGSGYLDAEEVNFCEMPMLSIFALRWTQLLRQRPADLKVQILTLVQFGIASLSVLDRRVLPPEPMRGAGALYI
jgi:hypothetical protein